MGRIYLVTGANGILGGAVVARLRARGEEVVPTDLPDVDLTRQSAARELVARVRPSHVIHCAAYTDVDGAEFHPDVCHAANALAPGYVAEACADQNARLLFISTDFVFDGSVGHPYLETDSPRPLSAYGRSKWEGEKAVAGALADHQIVRTAWLFGPGKRNFVTSVLDMLATTARPVRVVRNETGSPTYVLDLAEALIDLSQINATGIFHLVNGGQCSRFELAHKIAELAGFDPGRIVPIETKEWGSPAPRPSWSVLDCSRAYSLGVKPLRRWEEAVADFVGLLARARTE